VLRFDWFLAGLLLIPASLLGFLSASMIRRVLKNKSKN